MRLRTSLVVGAVLIAACGTSQVAEEPPTTVVVALTTTETIGVVATTGVSTTTTTETLGVVVVPDLVYFESKDGNALHLDVYHPVDGADLPLIVLFHTNPLFGGTKASVRDMATMMAERGAVVFAPSYGDRTFDPIELLEWFREQGTCAVWTALEMGPSYGGDPDNLILFGETTGSFPISTVTFSPISEAAECRVEPTDADVKAAYFFDQDWFLVGGDWDADIGSIPDYFATIHPWDDLASPQPTAVYILVGEWSDRDFYRSMNGETYAESDWTRLRDPEGDLVNAWAANGKLDDDRMSLTDVSGVFTDALLDAGWDAQLVTIPGTGHDLNPEAEAFVVDLIFEGGSG